MGRRRHGRRVYAGPTERESGSALVAQQAKERPLWPRCPVCGQPLALGQRRLAYDRGWSPVYVCQVDPAHPVGDASPRGTGP